MKTPDKTRSSGLTLIDIPTEMMLRLNVVVIFCVFAIVDAGSHTAAYTWTKSMQGTNDVCFGKHSQNVGDNCPNLESCTTSVWGTCNGTTPEAFVKNQITDFAQIKGSDSAYLTDSSLVTVVQPSTGLTKSAYSNADLLIGTALAPTADCTQAMMDSGDTSQQANCPIQYATMESGAFYGSDPSTTGAFLGTASYLLKRGSVAVNRMNIAGAAAPNANEATGFDACIAPLSGGACGGNVTFVPGQVKFSVYGVATGSSFTLPSDVTYVAARVKMDFVGFPSGYTVTFNDGTKSLTAGTPAGTSAIGGTDVTRIIITSTGPTLAINMKSQYNVGTGGWSQMMTPTATRNVKVKVSSAGADAIYADYLFAASDFQASGAWFIYDPTVRNEGVTQATTSNAFQAPLYFAIFAFGCIFSM